MFGGEERELGCGEGWGGEGLRGHGWLEGECAHWDVVGFGRCESGDGVGEVVCVVVEIKAAMTWF